MGSVVYELMFVVCSGPIHSRRRQDHNAQERRKSPHKPRRNGAVYIQPELLVRPSPRIRTKRVFVRTTHSQCRTWHWAERGRTQKKEYRIIDTFCLNRMTNLGGLAGLFTTFVEKNAGFRYAFLFSLGAAWVAAAVLLAGGNRYGKRRFRSHPLTHRPRD